MAFKFLVFAAFVAVARAGAIGYGAAPAYTSIAAPQISAYAAAPVVAKYSAAPAVSYSSISQPAVQYAAAPSYAHAAPAVSYAAPSVSYAAPAVAHSYAAPAVASYAAPAVASYAPVHKTIIAEPEAPANYDFGYSVNDPHTGDSKTQQETRHGDAVQGSYSLIDADGTKRTVEYTADAHNGFNAVVHKEPLGVKAVAAPVSYAAPAYAHAAPAYAHAAPAYAHAAPAVSYASHAAPSYYH